MLFDPALAMRGMWNLPERLAGDTRPMIESMIKLYLMLSGNMSVKVEDVLNYGAGVSNFRFYDQILDLFRLKECFQEYFYSE